jgi:hypothetical protein
MKIPWTQENEDIKTHCLTMPSHINCPDCKFYKQDKCSKTITIESNWYKPYQWELDKRLGTPTIPQTTEEQVNHPKHYTEHPSGIECIDITRHYNFNIGNAIKYCWRMGLKDNNSSIQDLKKAIWYLEDEIKKIGETK